MTLFNVFSLLGGLALFLFGMDIMGKALEKQAGGHLQKILSKLTDNPIKGFFLGLGVTAIIQSSSATTVMVVASSTAASWSCIRPSASSWAAMWVPPSPAGC
jgi:phosphate:Na+ symporter